MTGLVMGGFALMVAAVLLVLTNNPALFGTLGLVGVLMVLVGTVGGAVSGWD